MHQLETVHTPIFCRHCKDTSTQEQFVIPGLLLILTLFPLSPAKSFIGFFFFLCICHFVQMSMNKEKCNWADTIFMASWGCCQELHCMSATLGVLRRTHGPRHWWYSLLNIFKQAQMIFVKKKKKEKSLTLFIMVINYFIHDICFCLSLYNFKPLHWVFWPKNRDGTFYCFSRAGGALIIAVGGDLKIQETPRSRVRVLHSEKTVVKALCNITQK